MRILPSWTVPDRRRVRRRAIPVAAVLVAMGLAFAGALAGSCPGAGEAGCAAGEAFAARASDVVVECAGTVVRLLPDDDRGSRHQRFIVRLESRQTVLVSHNIDLAPRVASLQVGDPVRFRGEYEWNDRGGVVHWTHHDPRGRRPGGWIDHAGRRYR